VIPRPLDLHEYLMILWRRKWAIAVVALTSTAMALLFSYRQDPTYTSTAQVLVKPARFDPTMPSLAFGFINMTTEVQVANSLSVGSIARKHLADLKVVDPATATASLVPDAGVIQFAAASPTPAAAQASAQSYAEAYLEFRRNDVIEDLDAARRPLDEQLRSIGIRLRRTAAAANAASDPRRQQILQNELNSLHAQQADLISKRNDLPTNEAVSVGDVIQPANLPTSPSGPNHPKAGILGLIVGLGLGVGIGLFRERLDARVHGRDDMELHSRAPVLAFIPHIRSRSPAPIMLDQPTSSGAEAYKALRVRFLHAAAQQGFKTIVITSSVAGEGKTWTAANLGVALAQSGKWVALVSADLRQPRLHLYFPPENGTGLTDVLLRHGKLPEALSRTVVKNLRVLHAGAPLHSSTQLDLLGSDPMRQLLAELSSSADFVIIDTPPLLAVSDATVMATLADGVLFVADPSRVDTPTLQQSRLELELVGAPIIGVVVNNYNPRRFQAQRSRYRYAGYGPEPGTVPTVQVKLPAVIVSRDGGLAQNEEERTESQTDGR
jgi:capsular exopolysaccharide synthesis family protein